MSFIVPRPIFMVKSAAWAGASQPATVTAAAAASERNANANARMYVSSYGFDGTPRDAPGTGESPDEVALADQHLAVRALGVGRVWNPARPAKPHAGGVG